MKFLGISEEERITIRAFQTFSNSLFEGIYYNGFDSDYSCLFDCIQNVFLSPISLFFEIIDAKWIDFVENDGNETLALERYSDGCFSAEILFAQSVERSERFKAFFKNDF